MRTPSIQSIKDLGVAQLVARYLGVVEAVGSSPATQTKKQKNDIVRSNNVVFLWNIFCANLMYTSLPFTQRIIFLINSTFSAIFLVPSIRMMGQSKEFVHVSISCSDFFAAISKNSVSRSYKSPPGSILSPNF